MADETKNLALDLDPGARPGEKSLARIAVAEAWGFTRHGGGAVLTRDIFHGALAWSLGQGRKAHEQLLAATPVKDVMASRVVSVDPDAPLAEAAAPLREHKIGCLPVVAGDALVGVLTEGDFLALLARRA
jgi:CBS domain-containing protein